MRFAQIFLVFILIFVTFALLYYRFDARELGRVKRTAAMLSENDATAALVNGSGINNIPTLKVITTNDAIRDANSCGAQPLFAGPNGTDADCVRMCSNSTAYAFSVTNQREYYFEDRKLGVGTYCKLGKRPNCNPFTTRTLMTVNSVTCRSKFPELFGGAAGNDVVACNNLQIFDPMNQLWDYKIDQRVDPVTMTQPIADIDERLSDGSFRFRCNFRGEDSHHNAYMEHPFKRFHPMQNYCASNIRYAHPSVRTIVDVNTGKFTCDCGKVKITKVKHLVAHEPSSVCSDKSYKRTPLDTFRTSISIPYRCFNINSPITDVAKYPPCAANSFNDNSQTNSIVLTYSKNHDMPIEHPFFENFPDLQPQMLKPIQDVEIVT